jgi:hypothetical protein
MLLTPFVKQIGVRGKAPVFDSFQRRFVTGGVTLDHTTITPDANGQRIIYAGEVVGKIAATGLYAPWDNAVSDGREIARGVVIQDTNCTDGDAFIGIADECRIHVARMPRRFTDAQWAAIQASEFVWITRAEPYNVPGPKVISIAVLPDTIALTVGNTVQLSTVFVPTDAVVTDGTWASSAPAVATVSDTGLVTAASAGTANITFTAQDGGIVSAPAVVTVS